MSEVGLRKGLEILEELMNQINPSVAWLSLNEKFVNLNFVFLSHDWYIQVLCFLLFQAYMLV